MVKHSTRSGFRVSILTKTYKVQEINVSNEGRRGPGMGFRPKRHRSYTGDYLMKTGLNVGSNTPLTSVVYEITE